MLLSVPNVADAVNTPASNPASHPASYPASSASAPGGDGKPTPTGAFGDVLTAALGNETSPTDANRADAPLDGGTALPQAGITPPLDTATALDALLATLVAPVLTQDTAPEPDAADVTTGFVSVFANIPVEVQPAITSANAATTPVILAQQSISRQIELRELQALREALAVALSEAAGNKTSGAIADGVPRDPTAIAPSVAAVDQNRTNVQNGSATSDNALDSAALLQLKAALDGAQQIASQPDSGADQQRGAHTNQPPPVSILSATNRSTFAALADSFMHGQTTDIASNLAHRIQWMTQQGLQSARIAVTPRELGPIDIQLLQSDGALSVSITAQHPATRELLDASANRLRDMLVADGTMLQHFDVGNGQRGNREHDTGQRFARADSLTEVDALPAAPPVRIQLSLIDAYA